MHRRYTPRTAAPPSGSYALRLTRVHEGELLKARFLSAAIDGCLTHYIGERSEYCPGDQRCNPANHKRRVQWRGYVAAEVWNSATGLYYPTVFELTEYAEVEMRSRYRRGQIWQLSREMDKENVPQPVVPQLLGDVPVQLLQPAFDVRPVLCAIFRRADVRLGVSNPMPARVIVEAIAGEPPPGELGVPEQPTFDREAFERLHNDYEANQKARKAGAQ